MHTKAHDGTRQHTTTHDDTHPGLLHLSLPLRKFLLESLQHCRVHQQTFLPAHAFSMAACRLAISAASTSKQPYSEPSNIAEPAARGLCILHFIGFIEVSLCLRVLLQASLFCQLGRRMPFVPARGQLEASRLLPEQPQEKRLLSPLDQDRRPRRLGGGGGAI